MRKAMIGSAAMAAVLLAVMALPAAGQAAGEGVVTGNGIVTIKRTPDVMRVQVAISAEGKTLKDALAKLQQRKDAAKKKLGTLGATEASISISDPQLDANDPRRAQMMQMQRMRSGGRAPKGQPATPPVRVNAVVKAEWPLGATAGKPADELLLAAQAIQDKVKAADLADAKLSSAEEQEAKEENAGIDVDEQGTPAGEPSFTFVSKVSEQDRAKATADAFAKAKASATELAKAAGAELGAVKQVMAQAAPMDVEQMQYMQYGRYRGYGGGMPGADGNEAQQDEAVGLQATGVSLRVSVSASFAIK